MMNKKTQGIHGYLTPKKIISSALRGSKIGKTPTSAASRSPLSQSALNNPSKPAASKFQSMNHQSMVSNMQREDDPNRSGVRNTSMNMSVTRAPQLQFNPNDNSGIEDSSATHAANNSYLNRLNSSGMNQPNHNGNHSPNHNLNKNSFAIIQEDEMVMSGRDQQLHSSHNKTWNQQQQNDDISVSHYSNSGVSHDGRLLANLNLNNTHGLGNSIATASLQHPEHSQHNSIHSTNSRTRNNYGYNNLTADNNPEINTLQCRKLITKLQKVKDDLELEIVELQRLLDKTSQYKENMDEEFDRIKHHVLTYTALSLDNAYAEYKKSMAKWHEFEKFEDKSLQMRDQVNGFLNNEQLKLQRNPKPTTRQITLQCQELKKHIDFYGNFSVQIRQMRQQFAGMRPNITEDRIEQFQRGVIALCRF